MASRTLIPTLLACLGALPAVEFHVASTGNDGQAGTAQEPLRTIQVAARLAKPGDTVVVHGGTWRETIVPARSGTPDQPIVFQAAPGETVVLDGTEPVTGWTPWRDGIEQAPMAGDWFSRATPGDGVHLYDPLVHNQADQVFVDGQMVTLARWPNSPTLDPSFPKKAVTAKFISKSRDKARNWTTGTLEDPAFDLPASAAVGAQVMVQPNFGAWAWIFTGRITAVDGHRWTYQSRSDSGKDFKQDLLDDKSRYIIFDKLDLLDAPGEWYHDKPAGRLYLKAPDGKPLEGRVSAKRREFAFDLTDRSHITIRGFTLHACTITTDRDSGGDGVPNDENGGTRYPWRNAAHGLPQEPWHQPEAFRDAPSSNVVLEDLDARYLSHFTDVSGHFFCQWGQSSGIVLSGRNHRITGSRIRWSAGNGITLLGREHQALGNLIEDTGYAANDCAAVHTGGTERISSDHEIAWNTIRRTGRSGLLPRYFYRSEVAGTSPTKGRVHHNDISQFGIQDWDVGGIYGAGPGRYLRFDHNWIHDAYEHVDDLGQGAFTASGIYPDYGASWMIDHNVIWNVEWGIHLQNQDNKTKPAGYLVFNNTVAVRMLGGQKSMHGPYGVVRNSEAPNQDTLIEDNVLVLLDGSARYKAVDFASDPAQRRSVDGNAEGGSLESLGLVGGTAFPEALVPGPGATQIIGTAKSRSLGTSLGMTLPPSESGPDRGAFAAGAPPWRPGHEAWPGRQPPAPVVARAAVPSAPVVPLTPPVAPESAPPITAAVVDPVLPKTEEQGLDRRFLILGAVVAGLGTLLVIILARKTPTTTRRLRRR